MKIYKITEASDYLMEFEKEVKDVSA